MRHAATDSYVVSDLARCMRHIMQKRTWWRPGLSLSACRFQNLSPSSARPGIAPTQLAERWRADSRLAALLAQLGGLQFGDIAIRRFREHHDGVTFGLIDESGDRSESWAELYPDGLGLCEPWDGSYII